MTIHTTGIHTSEIPRRELGYLRRNFLGRETIRSIAQDEGLSAGRVAELIRQAVQRLVERELWLEEVMRQQVPLLADGHWPSTDTHCFSCNQPLSPEELARRAERGLRREAEELALEEKFKDAVAARSPSSDIVHLVSKKPGRYYGVSQWLVCGGSGVHAARVMAYSSLDAALRGGGRVCESCHRTIRA